MAIPLESGRTILVASDWRRLGYVRTLGAKHSAILAATGLPPIMIPVNPAYSDSSFLAFDRPATELASFSFPFSLAGALARGRVAERPLLGSLGTGSSADRGLGSGSLSCVELAERLDLVRLARISWTFARAFCSASKSSAICFADFSPDLRPRYPTQLTAPHRHSTRLAPSATPKASKL